MRISDWSSDVCSSDLFLHVIFAEELYDADFVTANAVGLDVLKRAVAGFTPDHVSRVVGVPKNQILLAARTFAAAKSGCVVTATGAHFPLHGTLAEYLALCIRSEEHTSELQSLMRISYAVFCLKKKKHKP